MINKNNIINLLINKSSLGIMGEGWEGRSKLDLKLLFVRNTAGDLELVTWVQRWHLFEEIIYKHDLLD